MPSSVSREGQALERWAASHAAQPKAPEPSQAMAPDLAMLAQALGQLAPSNARTTTIIQQSMAAQEQQEPHTQMQFVDRITTDLGRLTDPHLLVQAIRATSARLRTLQQAALSLHRETSVFQCQELMGCANQCHASLAHLVDPQSLILPTLLP